METLNKANPFFIRCIKSNAEKAPCKFDDVLVLRQLRYTGMLATVRIRQSGYNYRLTFEVCEIIWAPSSEFVSSSIPSWQILTAHVQPFRGASDLVFCLKVPLDSLLVWASSEGSGETARMRRLAWTFAARIGDKYQICLTRSIYGSGYEACDRVRLKLDCSTTEASKSLGILDRATVTTVIKLSRQGTTEMQMRQHGCAGWSVSLLFAYGIKK